jgi:hypothetical protein
MITGVDVNSTVDYSLKRDKSNPTIWKIGIIPALIFMKLSQEAKGNEVESAYKILQVSIKGWDNFKGPDYQTVKETFFGREMDVVPLSLLEQIPVGDVLELSMEALKINQIGEQERKN